MKFITFNIQLMKLILWILRIKDIEHE